MPAHVRCILCERAVLHEGGNGFELRATESTSRDFQPSSKSITVRDEGLYTNGNKLFATFLAVPESEPPKAKETNRFTACSNR